MWNSRVKLKQINTNSSQHERVNIMLGTDTCTSICAKCKALLCAHPDWNHLLKNDNFQWWSNRIRHSINSFGRRPTSKVTSWLQTSRPQQASAAALDGGLQETVYWDPSLINAFSASASPLLKPHVGVQLPAPDPYFPLSVFTAN